MEGNKDEAFRCIALAQEYHDEGNDVKAEKLLLKSLRMYPTHQAMKTFEKLFRRKPPTAQDADTGGCYAQQSSSVPPNGSGKSNRKATPHSTPFATPTQSAKKDSSKQRQTQSSATPDSSEWYRSLREAFYLAIFLLHPLFCTDPKKFLIECNTAATTRRNRKQRQKGLLSLRTTMKY